MRTARLNPQLKLNLLPLLLSGGADGGGSGSSSSLVYRWKGVAKLRYSLMPTMTTTIDERLWL